jgi:hypothetical protein
MEFPLSIQSFLLSPSPPEEAAPLEDHSDVEDLREWLRITLGGALFFLFFCLISSFSS